MESISSVLSVLKDLKAREILGLTGRFLGFGLFLALILTYCHDLLETCFRGIQ